MAVGPVLGWRADAAYAAGAGRGPAVRTVPFDADWLFGGPAVPGSTEPDFDDSTFGQVTLPHTVTDLSWRDWDPATWQDVWIYRRRFRTPPRWAGHRIFLDFEGAMTATTLTLNGRKVGEHVDGYLPFSFEVTDDLADGENVLALELDSRFDINVPPNRPGEDPASVDFWQPGGIYRPAHLRAVPQVFVADVFAKPVDVLEASRHVAIECTLDAAVVPDGSARVEVELRDGDRTVSSASVATDITETGRTRLDLTLTELGDIELWDTDNPRLYDVITTLVVDEQPVHDYATRIGFREARFTKQGFFLNGREVKLFGLNRHQFYPFAGGSMPARVQRKDAEILKRDLNCNMVRCSHYPQSDAFFDACDELGLLAWEEAPGWGLYMGDEQWQDRAVRIVGDMVRRGRNHPSIVLWGARINETPDNVELWTRTRDLAHRLDDSRQTTGAMIGPLYDSENYVQDVFSMNDYWREDGHAAVRPPRTEFPYLVSEAVGTLSGPAKAYTRVASMEDQQGQALAHAWVHQESFADERYCGLLAWGAYDYVSGTGNRQWGVKFIGVLDLFRVPKFGAAIYQSQIDPKERPVIAPAFAWQFGATALPMGSGQQAMICSNCERLELYVDNAPYATLEPDTDRFADLPYPPSFVDFGEVDGSAAPELRIDGYVGDAVVVSRTFSSDTSGDTLEISADDTQLDADGSDATRVVFRVLDQHGAPRSHVQGDVTITVDGPGILVGESPFAFADAGGVGAVWVRTVRGVAGPVTVTVTHPTLGARQVVLHTSRPSGVERGVHVDLTLTAERSLFVPGEATSVTATCANHGPPTLTDVQLGLSVPAGWAVEATSATHHARVRPDRAAETTWTVTPPADAEPGPARLVTYSTFTAEGRHGSRRTDLTVRVPAPAVPLAQAYDNAGISADSDVDAADYDGVGNSYSRQALTAAGLAPGATVDHKGLTFTWPDTAAGDPDNLVADGQTIELSGSGDTIGFLGSGSSTSASGTGAIYYADGTTSQFDITLSDWWFEPGPDNDTVAATPYVNSRGTGGRPRGQRDHTVRVFFASAPIRAGKQVSAVRLPDTTAGGDGRIIGMHIFSLAVGSMDARGG